MAQTNVSTYFPFENKLFFLQYFISSQFRSSASCCAMILQTNPFASKMLESHPCHMHQIFRAYFFFFHQHVSIISLANQVVLTSDANRLPEGVDTDQREEERRESKSPSIKWSIC